MKTKRKIHRTKAPTWNTHTYSGLEPSKFPFNIEWMKYFNPAEGRDQIMFIYTDKITKKVCKYRVMR